MINQLQKQQLQAYFDGIAAERDRWSRRTRLYHQTIKDYCAFMIPPGASVLELGCGTGDLLNAVKPGRGVGIDFSRNMVALAVQKYPHLSFIHADAEEFT